LSSLGFRQVKKIPQSLCQEANLALDVSLSFAGMEQNTKQYSGRNK